MKYLIITIDTEGDNQWNWKQGDPIYTENIKYIPRFQELCNRYGFKPVWLSNYEMIIKDEFVSYMKDQVIKNGCEVGVHIHAWNSPPEYSLPSCDQSGQPYLIEYPVHVMQKKILYLTNLFVERFGFAPTSHRAGRWAINDSYINLLCAQGYKVDCSVVPGIDMTDFVGQTPGFPGPDFSNASNSIEFHKSLLEVPVTILRTRHYFNAHDKGIKNSLRPIIHMIKSQDLWLRPNGHNVSEMLYVLNTIYASECDYAMYMIHSSELMPGGSPTFKTDTDIENLYTDTKCLFEEATKLGYIGITLKDYYAKVMGEHNA